MLTLPGDFPLPTMTTALSPRDASHDGSDERYLAAGLAALRVVEAAIEAGAPPRRILELACGHGRTTRFLRARFPHSAITACDPDPEALDFVARCFDATTVAWDPALDATGLGAPFDLIWTGETLARASEAAARRLLDVAARHMHAGSLLVVATNGAHVARLARRAGIGLDDAATCGLLADHLAAGHGFRRTGPGVAAGVALVERRWLEALLPRGPLRLQSYRARGLDRRQDVAVLRLAPQGPAARLRARLSRLRGAARTDYEAGAPPPETAEAAAARDRSETAGFDERWYLTTNDDVAQAVASGDCPSGGWHYRRFGWREGRLPADGRESFEARTPPPAAAYLDGAARGGKVSEFWSESPADTALDQGGYWAGHPIVRARVNRLASDSPVRDAYDRLATLLDARGIARPITSAVSLGCGFGALERDLVARGLVARIDAYDIADGAIREATREAARLGLSGIRYHLADLDRIALEPHSVDVVFGHAAVHHVEKLETLYATVHRTLRAGGLFHLHEFVGPTRFQWTDAQLALINAFTESLPERLRALPDGTPKPLMRRPTIEEMIAADPSESVRSSELVGCLEPWFDIVERRDLGGAVLHMALGGIVQNFRPDDPVDVAILEALFETEDRAMRDGSIGSDFAVITAAPKRDPVARG